jgi:sulfane dehydrogenase subunit SoxC
MNSKKSDRRGFLKRSAALAGLAAFANGKALASVTPDLINGGNGDAPTPKEGVSVEAPTNQDLLYGGRSRFETTTRMIGTGSRAAGGLKQLTPLQDSVGAITAASFHYVVMHDMYLPDIDPRDHKLLIHGMVDRPTVFTLEEIKRFPSVSRVHFLECTGNSGVVHYKAYMHDLKVGRKGMTMIQAVHGRTSSSEWTGVLLSLLLKEVGVQKQAKWVVSQGMSTEGRARSMTLAKGMDDVFVAYAQNGEAIRREQGYPLRLLVPGFQGTFNIKYLTDIKLVDKPYYIQAEAPGYTNLKPDGKASWYESQVGPKSVITFPSDPHKLSGRGFYEISGIAWSGRGKIARVEVSTDNGRTWKDADLQQPIFTKAWTRFRHPWNWDGAETVIMSRCTNEYGDIQPTLMELARLWGMDEQWFDPKTPAIPAEKVLSFWETASITEFLNNPIQLWSVKPDGTVHDATYSVLPNLSESAG